ncbi:hypothetical protein ZOSMA_84G00160 [Zostera marina]|uniref:GIL1/IRKI C-terminal domain-containing protein n=1 Tax=Zostera marina TaxID=29655 RepID=A0A0K9NLD0_ZOSMR|nr:hypothetical protein ZOSMA_84G00160 [Zostera marina]
MYEIFRPIIPFLDLYKSLNRMNSNSRNSTPKLSRMNQREESLSQHSSILESLSSLRMHCIQFQQAQLDSNLACLKSAVDAIITQFEELSHLESSSSLITAYELLLEAMKKEYNAFGLKLKLKQLVGANNAMEDEIRKSFSLAEDVLFSSDQDFTPELFLNIHQATVSFIRDFSVILFESLKTSTTDAHFIIRCKAICNTDHKNMLCFEAYVTRKMYILDQNGHMEFPHPRFFTKEKDIDTILKFADPLDALANYPDSEFSGFCRIKYLSIVHPAIEFNIFGNLHLRDSVGKWIHPRTHFYASFVKMATWVWISHVMSALLPSRDRPVMFQAKKGARYVGDHMEAASLSFDKQHPAKVAFTVTPGFKIGAGLIKCKVHVVRTKEEN